MLITGHFDNTAFAACAVSSLCLLLAACTQDAAADKLAGLEGTSWQVVGLPKNVNAFVSFGSNGKLNGNAGCNRFFATYTTSDQAIQIGQVGRTRKLCPPVEMSVERELLRALPIVSRWSGNAKRIELTAPIDKTVIRLKRSNKP